jgi:hypothetical protein
LEIESFEDSFNAADAVNFVSKVERETFNISKAPEKSSASEQPRFDVLDFIGAAFLVGLSDHRLRLMISPSTRQHSTRH